VPYLREIDVGQLRRGRLARSQDAMERHGLAIAPLSNPANIR
jgi:hypothetical protein